MTFHASESSDRYPVEGHGPGSADSDLRIDGAGEYYAFGLVPAHGLLHIKISGFWTLDTAAHFACDLPAAIALLDRGPGEHLVCCDVTDSAIQSQEVVSAFQALIVDGSNHARKMALFTTRLLSRMQARRIVAVRDRIAVFETEAAALLWLLAKDDAAA